MVSGQIQVNHQELTDTGTKTGDTSDDAKTIQQKIQAAQVPQNAWGIVGLLTVGEYEVLLAALNDHMSTMSQGIQNLASTIQQIASNYKENEDSVAETFSDVEKDLGDTAQAPTAKGA